MNLLQFAAHLAEAVVTMELATHAALEDAAKIVEHEAKDIMGHYQAADGPYAAWAPLAASTLDGYHGHPGKIAKGQAPPDNPLLATGELRDSISHVVSGHTAVVGSNQDDAVYHELGTRTEPPRPVLGMAAVHKEHEVAHLLGQSIVQHIIRRRLP